MQADPGYPSREADLDAGGTHDKAKNAGDKLEDLAPVHRTGAEPSEPLRPDADVRSRSYLLARAVTGPAKPKKSLDYSNLSHSHRSNKVMGSVGLRMSQVEPAVYRSAVWGGKYEQWDELNHKANGLSMLNPHEAQTAKREQKTGRESRT